MLKIVIWQLLKNLKTEEGKEDMAFWRGVLQLLERMS